METATEILNHIDTGRRVYVEKEAGFTRGSLKFFQDHKHHLGPGPFGITLRKVGYDFQVEISTALAGIVLKGCSWGYSGEGPRGLKTVLSALGPCSMDPTELSADLLGFTVEAPPSWYNELPEICYHVLESRCMVVEIHRGEVSYKHPWTFKSLEEAQKNADSRNRCCKVSARQKKAMLSGIRKGWFQQGANPKRYKETS